LSDACPPSVDVDWRGVVSGQASDSPKQKEPFGPSLATGSFTLIPVTVVRGLEWIDTT